MAEISPGQPFTDDVITRSDWDSQVYTSYVNLKVEV